MFVRIAALTAAIFITFVSVASAQQVLTLNRERVLTESAVGQHIATRIEAIGAQIDQELAAQRAPIEQEGQRLKAETQALTSESLQQRPDLMQRIQDLQTQGQEFQRAQQKAIRELQATEAQALRPVGEALQPIIASIAEERSALVVLNQGNVVYAANSTDVTAEVINRLNAQLSTVDVTRVRLPEQQAAQAQQQQ